MTQKECVARIQNEAFSVGMTVAEYADAISNATSEDIAIAMESLPTDTLEWAVRFEAAGHRR